MDLSNRFKRLETIQRDKNKHTTIEVWLGEWDEKENEYPKSLRSHDKTIVFNIFCLFQVLGLLSVF